MGIPICPVCPLSPEGARVRLRRLMFGSASRVSARMVTLVVSFMLVPVILRNLTAFEFGIWTLSATFLGYYGLADFGVGSAVARFASRAMGARDSDEYNRVYATSLAILTCIGAALFVIILAAAFSVRRLSADGPMGRMYFWIIAILGANLAAQAPLRVFTGLLTSHIRYDILSLTQSVQAIVRAGAVILLFRMHRGLLSLVAVSALLDLLNGLFRGALCRIVCSDITPRLSDVRWKTAQSLLGYGAYTMISQISDLLRFRIGPFVITLVRGAAAVGPYAVAMRVEESISRLTLAVVAVFSPLFSRYEGAEKKAEMRALYLAGGKVAAYVAVLFGGMTLALGRPFMQRWLAGTSIDIATVIPILTVLVCAGILSSSQYATVGFLFGTSRNDIYARINIIHGIAALGLSIALIHPFGLLGVAMGGSLASFTFSFIVLPVFAARALGIRPAAFYTRHLPSVFFPPVAYLACFILIARPLVHPTYPSLFAWGSAGSIGYAGFILMAGFNAIERRRLWQALGMRTAGSARRSVSTLP